MKKSPSDILRDGSMLLNIVNEVVVNVAVSGEKDAVQVINVFPRRTSAKQHHKQRAHLPPPAARHVTASVTSRHAAGRHGPMPPRDHHHEAGTIALETYLMLADILFRHARARCMVYY